MAGASVSDGPLNIEVVGDSESCRANVSWLNALHEGVGRLVTAFTRTAGESESFWHGAAGDTFRGHMANAKGNATQVEDAVSTLSRALSTFADELDTVKSRMNQAREVAAHAGLTVTNTEILPPSAGPGPAPPAPTGNVSPQQVQEHDNAVSQHNAAVATHQQQVAAFNEVSATVLQARGKEKAAHEALQGTTKQHQDLLDKLKTYGQMPLSKAVALTGGLSGASQKLLNSANKSKGLAVLATALRSNPSLSPEANTALQEAQQELFEKMYKDQADRAGIERIIGVLPQSVRGVLTLNASDLVKKLGGIDQNIPEAFQKGLPVLKRLPVVGTALTAFFAANDISDGKDPVKTTENAVGGTAASMGVSAGIEAAVGAAEAAGLAVPGPGWVVSGTLALGTAAAFGVGYVVDHYGDQINHAVGSAADGVGHAAEGAAKKVERFVGDLF